jgi:hypothetical protein
MCGKVLYMTTQAAAAAMSHGQVCRLWLFPDDKLVLNLQMSCAQRPQQNGHPPLGWCVQLQHTPSASCGRIYLNEIPARSHDLHSNLLLNLLV